MYKVKYLTAILLCITVITSCAQENGTYLLKWKLQAKEVLTYKTLMKSDEDPEMNFNGFSKQMGIDSNSEEKGKMNTMLKDMQRFAPEYYLTHLEKDKKGVINIEVMPHSDKTPNDTSGNEGFSQLVKAMSTGVALRGAIDESGNIKSFYLRNDQANIIAMLFQLPGKPVKVGDTWEVGTNLISMDQNFKCDSSFRKNEAKVSSVEKIKDDQVVTIYYNIEEFVAGSFSMPFPQPGQGIKNNVVETSMKMTYKATARFSIKRGRWLSYDGVLKTVNDGLMSGHSSMKYALMPQ